MFVDGYRLPIPFIRCFGEAVVFCFRNYRFIVDVVSSAFLVVAHCSVFGVLFMVRSVCSFRCGVVVDSEFLIKRNLLVDSIRVDVFVCAVACFCVSIFVGDRRVYVVVDFRTLGFFINLSVYEYLHIRLCVDEGLSVVV